MKNTYMELLEQIITEMKTALYGDGTTSVDGEYRKWLNFLKNMHPESRLVENDRAEHTVAVQKVHNYPFVHIQLHSELTEYSDLCKIIQLATSCTFSIWYIQPHFMGSHMQLTYENGELKNMCSSNTSAMAKNTNEIPPNVAGFSGTVSGICLDNEELCPTFIAYDLDNDISFLEKMSFLKASGFVTLDFVLLSTDKLLTISMSKLETLLLTFISTVQTSWAKVDGVVIISDTSYSPTVRRIIFKPRQPAV